MIGQYLLHTLILDEHEIRAQISSIDAGVYPALVFWYNNIFCIITEIIVKFPDQTITINLHLLN